MLWAIGEPSNLAFKKPPFPAIVLCTGPLTQVAEYLPFKQRVAGSNPARPTIGNAEASFHL